MNNWPLYRNFLTMILMICTLKSWGSAPLPQLTFYEHRKMVYRLTNDTIPSRPEAQPVDQSKQEPVIDPQTKPITKQVPRSRKKLKPVAVNPPPVRVPAAPVIKPKIVIKKITIKTR